MTHSRQIANIFYFIHYLGAINIPIAFLYFSQVYFKKDTKINPLISVGIVLAVLQLALFLKGNLVGPLSPKWKFTFYTNPEKYYVGFMAYFFIYVIYSFILMLQSIMNEKNKAERKKKLFLIAATGIGYISGSSAFLLVYVDRLPPYPIYIFLLFPMITTYGIFKHRLLDIEIIIKKTLIFTGVFSFLFGIFAFVLFFITDVLQQRIGGGLRWWLLATTCAIAVLTSRKLELFLVEVTDKYLFQKKFDYRKVLKTASEGLANINSLNHQLRLVVHFLTMRVWIKRAAIYMPQNGEKDFVLKTARPGAASYPEKIAYDSPILLYLKAEKKKTYLEHRSIEEAASKYGKTGMFSYDLPKMLEDMKRLRAQLIVPSFFQGQLQGILVLGDKKSEEGYSEEDIQVFQTIAQESAIAFENARKHDELVAERDKVAQMNDELRKSQEQVIITKQEAAVSQLSGGIAHEVKNSIVGLIGGLDETQNAFETITRNLNDWYRSGRSVPYAEKQELFFSLKNAMESLEYARGESLHIDDIVHTLSQLSKGQYAQMTRILLTTFLNRMISVSMLRTYGDQVRTQALEDPPELIVEDKVSAVRGHTELLKAVFINLFKNAIFAMDNVQSKKIRIYVAQDSPDKVRIEFSDNGCGIPPEVLPKIFDYGFTTKGAEGEGKGLHNVKMILEKEHKGSIDVKSEVGKGTTFIIKLPVWKDRPDE